MPEGTSHRAPGDAQRLRNIVRVKPPGEHERYATADIAQQLPVEASAEPPGREASRGGRASKQIDPQFVDKLEILERSARSAIGKAFITGKPDSRRTALTRSGVSRPCS